MHLEPVAVDSKVEAARQAPQDIVDIASLEGDHGPAALADHMMLVSLLDRHVCVLSRGVRL